MRPFDRRESSGGQLIAAPRQDQRLGQPNRGNKGAGYCTPLLNKLELYAKLLD